LGGSAFLLVGVSPIKTWRVLRALLSVACCVCACALVVRAQMTNPVERQVTNPVTDTPNVNPLQQEQPVRPRKPTQPQGAAAVGDEISIDAEHQTVVGPKDAHVIVYEGNVDIHVGIYRLQADKVTDYEASSRVIAEGNVVFDQGDQQRITGSRAEFNYRTKLGYFVNSTGFTNQTEDGTILYFTADSVERVAINKVVITNGTVTACDESVPKWSFKTKRAVIVLNERFRARNARFRIKNIPVLFMPYVSVSIKKRDRASGFLTPTFGGSGQKGFRFSDAYYRTLGRSADVTFRTDIYTQRGLGFGAELRTRANSRSFFDMGFYTFKDRIFGPKTDAQHPDQGGSSFYVNGVHYFPNGFLAAANVDITSSLAFRQVFSESIQRVISPEERSEVFINKNGGDYSFNTLMRSDVTTLPSASIRIRELPGIEFDKRPSLLSFIKKLPVYFSFEGGIEGMNRKETVLDLASFQTLVGNKNPIITPSIVQRLDFHPDFMIPFSAGGWSVTITGGARSTFYSNSIDPLTRLVLGRDVTRTYGEFEVDIRPPALARNYRRNGKFSFRHVIEPYLIYRKIGGINNFDQIILFDSTDAIADTSEIEYGITNRFFTRRSTENVSGRTPSPNNAQKAPLTSQPYEVFSLTVRGKYFFDPYFGGALIPGERNQFFPINTFSGFSYGGVPRRFSPLNIESRFRPRRQIFFDVRTDFDVQRAGLRDLATSFGVRRTLVQAFETFYYTRALKLAPSLQQFADARGREAGTLKGAQWSPSIFLGNRGHGLFGGAAFFFDFQNRPGKNNALVSSVWTLGYTWACCSVTAQDFSYNVGLRRENRVVFSFRLNGIGTFGTEQIGQNFR
jgi:LPS-assembly protein